MQHGIRRHDYDDIESIFLYRKDIISKKHASKLRVFQETIGLLFYMTVILNASFLDDFSITGKLLKGPKSIIPILFERNNHYLIAAYKLACIGLNSPSYLNLRAVFEGITYMYLLYLTDEEANLLYKKQLGSLTADEEKALISKYQWLRPSRIREILYFGAKKKQIDEFYILISNSAHPSVKSAMGDFDYREEITVDVLSIALASSAASLITINDIYFDNFRKEEIEEIENMINRVTQELDGHVVDIIPNHPSLEKARS
jgi:hypothetical protein